MHYIIPIHYIIKKYQNINKHISFILKCICINKIQWTYNIYIYIEIHLQIIWKLKLISILMCKKKNCTKWYILQHILKLNRKNKNENKKKTNYFYK